MDISPKLRRFKWYGIFLVVAGTVGAIGWVASGIYNVVDELDELTRVDMPGTKVVYLEKGEYTAYYESESGDEDDLLGIKPSDLQLQVEPVTGLPPVTVRDYDTSFTYNLGSRSGKATGSFTIDVSGRYAIEAGPPLFSEGSIVIGPAIGSPLITGALWVVLGFILWFFGVGGLGAAILTDYDRKKQQRVR